MITVNKTQGNKSSATTIKMRSSKVNAKGAKPFDMHKFLVKHHDEDNIHFFGAINDHYWNWAKQIRNNNVSSLEGLIILLDKNDKVLYIGHTSHIGSYVVTLSSRYNVKVNKVFIVCNENPSMYVHAVGAYRAKFKPSLNSERNQRFMFDSSSTVINLNTKSEKALQWIINNPDSSRKEFESVYSQSDLTSLCKCFSINRISYKDLKAKVLKTKSSFRVVNQQEILNA